MVVVVPGSYPPPDTFNASAFADFLDLRTAVIEHVRDASISDVFPRLVAMAESRLNRTLRMREQIVSGTITMVNGRADLPANFAEIIGLYDLNGGEYPQQATHQQGGYFYSIQGAEIVAPRIVGPLRLDFYAMLPPLGDSLTTTNWLLARYPDVYLYAAAFEAAKYLREAELAAATKLLLDDALSTAKGDDEASRYSRARVRVAGVNP